MVVCLSLTVVLSLGEIRSDLQNTIALGIWDNLTAQLLNFKNGVILEHACVDASRLILVLVSDQVFVTRRCLIVSMSIHSGLTRTEKLC